MKSQNNTIPVYNTLKIIGIFTIAFTNGVIIVILLQILIASFSVAGHEQKYINQRGTISDSYGYGNNPEPMYADSDLPSVYSQSTQVENDEKKNEVTKETIVQATETIKEIIRETKIEGPPVYNVTQTIMQTSPARVWDVDSSLQFEEDVLSVRPSALPLNDLSGVLAIENGGTGATSAAQIRENLGLTSGGEGDLWLAKTGGTIGKTGLLTTLTKQGELSGDEFFVGTTGAFRVQRNTSNSEAFRVQIAGDTQGRWVGTSDGRLRWGDGSNPTDVTLRRNSTGTLALEGGIILNNLQENRNIVIKGNTDPNLFFSSATHNAVGIGTSSPTQGKLQIYTTAGTGLFLDNRGNDDSIRDDSGARLSSTGVWTDASDQTKKTAVETLPYGIETLMELHPVKYEWKENGEADIGFLAQEVKKVIPEIVYGTEGNMSLSYSHLTALLVKAVQDQQQQLQRLDTNVTFLETTLDPDSTASALVQETTDLSPDPLNTQPLSNTSLEQLTVTGLANLYDVSIANSFTTGVLSIQGLTEAGGAELMALSGSLKLTAEDIELSARETVSIPHGRLVGNDSIRGISVPVESTKESVTITFPEPRPTESYAVSVTPSWITAIAVAEKTPEGFQVKFSEPPPEGAAIDWIVLE